MTLLDETLGTLPIRCDDCGHGAHEPEECTGEVEVRAYGMDGCPAKCPCDIGSEGWRLTGAREEVRA